MSSGCFHFEDFRLNPGERQLSRGNLTLELSSRYLDALALLLRDQGKLVSKERFFEEVWQGVPVTDEALTQCIKTLRRQLGDDAANPRFIETIPKHGYRFIAPVEWIATDRDMPPSTPPHLWRAFFRQGFAATIGGGVAGILVGLFYGFIWSSQTLQTGMGAISVLLVLISLSILAGLIAGAGVGFGIAAAAFATRRLWIWIILGGACGGLAIGAFAKLLGLDIFALLFGQSPSDITGAFEGALFGGAIGFGLWMGRLGPASQQCLRSIVATAFAGAVTGSLIPLLSGRLMGGSLDLLARHFPGSRLRFEQIGAMFGESDFGLISQMATGGVEGMIFGGCIAAAMTMAWSR